MRSRLAQRDRNGCGFQKCLLELDCGGDSCKKVAKVGAPRRGGGPPLGAEGGWERGVVSWTTGSWLALTDDTNLSLQPEGAGRDRPCAAEGSALPLRLAMLAAIARGGPSRCISGLFAPRERSTRPPAKGTASRSAMCSPCCSRWRDRLSAHRLPAGG